MFYAPRAVMALTVNSTNIGLRKSDGVKRIPSHCSTQSLLRALLTKNFVRLSFLRSILLFSAFAAARAQASVSGSTNFPSNASRRTHPETPPNQSARDFQRRISFRTTSPAHISSVRVNVVLVHVVVRDNNGKVISNLKKQDFQSRDERKPQDHFEFLRRESCFPRAYLRFCERATSRGTPVKAADLPRTVRHALLRRSPSLAARRQYFRGRPPRSSSPAMGARDRLSIFSTSGEVEQDFTADRGSSKRQSRESCRIHSPKTLSRAAPPMTLDEAFMIAAAADPTAMQVAHSGLYELQRNAGGCSQKPNGRECGGVSGWDGREYGDGSGRGKC